MQRLLGWVLVVGLASGCAGMANVTEEQNTLMRLDREWAAAATDPDKFTSYFAADANVYAPGTPIVTGTGPIRKMMGEMMAAPGFSLQFTPARAVVGKGGDVGYTTGTYTFAMAGTRESGKYVTIWKKQADGQWKVAEDIFNADGSGAPASAHVMVMAPSITWGDPPPMLPPGSKVAVISGDPTKPGPFTIRLQMPSGYVVPPHWHPTTEDVTVLSGTLALGMGDKIDEASMKDLTAGGYVSLPADMRHYVRARSAATLQITSTGPFVINYVNPADDPSKKK